MELITPSHIKSFNAEEPISKVKTDKVIDSRGRQTAKFSTEQVEEKQVTQKAKMSAYAL